MVRKCKILSELRVPGKPGHRGLDEKNCPEGPNLIAFENLPGRW